MKLVMVRHMTTDFNARGILQGRRDIPILDPGPLDLEKIQANLITIRAQEGAGYDHVLTSRLKRTQMTADLYGYASQMEPLADELDFGPYEGRPRQTLLAEQPLWINRPDQVELGESLSDLKKRVTGFCQKYQACARVLVFGHGAWIRGLVSCVRTGSIQRMNQMDLPNNQVVVLDIEKGQF
ncbi:MAG: phosphoglycerate mutase family protein [Desulfobacter sp.]|nr:phosphoglycerate mutase family protein [Desulfobacter sp.]